MRLCFNEVFGFLLSIDLDWIRKSVDFMGFLSLDLELVLD